MSEEPIDIEEQTELLLKLQPSTLLVASLAQPIVKMLRNQRDASRAIIRAMVGRIKELEERVEQDIPFEPDYAVPPGHILEDYNDELVSEDWTKEDVLAACRESTGLTEEGYEHFYSGVRVMDDELALALSRWTARPITLWLNLEKNYRADLVRLGKVQ